MPYARAEILIQAPITLVWDVMLDVRNYAQWNPFIEKIGCADPSPKLGSDLELHVHFANGKRHQTVERIIRLDPPEEIDGVVQATLEYIFLGRLADWNLVRGQRPQVITQHAPDCTHYLTDETLRGWLAWATPIKQVQDGFERHAAALKQRCEKLYQDRSA